MKSVKSGRVLPGGSAKPVEIELERAEPAQTRSEMMKAFRALREQRRTVEEADVVIDRIVQARGPRSLHRDLTDDKR